MYVKNLFRFERTVEMKLSLFIDQVILNGSPIDLLQSFIALGFWVVYFFFFFNLGDEVIQEFQRVGDVVYDTSWYFLPPSFRKPLITMMIISQSPIKLKVCDTQCDRQLFWKVCVIRKIE